ncbi:hypothetical protein [Sphingobacterium allocomposti]|uniref:hypothetical protein n=1 Tax=Sphingobacterium allocomposti TaxID=415956 RepID=UPI0011E84744|nr:hypothetical protein [Sphingobacterium composti Yoo et al. 2007 non Ten et al. 2007]
MNLEDIPREDTVCRFTILEKAPVMILDTKKDERTTLNAILREAGIRCSCRSPAVERGVIDYLRKKHSWGEMTRQGF